MKGLALALYFLLACLLGGGGDARPMSALSTEQIDAFLFQLSHSKQDLSAKIGRVSERFLGVPYLLSPLGEGPGNLPDPDPLMRLDAVDCTTLVEQVMALSQASNQAEALHRLGLIRYRQGEIGYQQRKHFMAAQWIPLNQAAGFIEDVTIRLGGDRVRWVEMKLDRAAWQRRRQKEKWPELTPSEIPLGRFRLPIIELEKFHEVVDRIPAGVILNVVRQNLANVPVLVSHQGLVVVKRGRRYLRHAARAGYGRVVDELLSTFLRRNRAYTKWTVSGFNFQQILPKDVRYKNSNNLER